MCYWSDIYILTTPEGCRRMYEIAFNVANGMNLDNHLFNMALDDDDNWKFRYKKTPNSVLLEWSGVVWDCCWDEDLYSGIPIGKEFHLDVVLCRVDEEGIPFQCIRLGLHEDDIDIWKSSTFYDVWAMNDAKELVVKRTVEFSDI